MLNHVGVGSDGFMGFLVGPGAVGSTMPQESKILEGHLQADYVHMLVTIPPKYSVTQVVGFIKSKSAIQIVRNYLGQRKNFHGMHF